jgi:predicted ribosomally synthesized peptide with nif11-like leader
MSIQNARKFAERISKEPALQKTVSTAGSAKGVVAVAQKHGLDFTVNDLFKLEAEWKAGHALSPEALEKVALNAAADTEGRCGTIGSCMTEPETCGTPCCKVEPM